MRQELNYKGIKIEGGAIPFPACRVSEKKETWNIFFNGDLAYADSLEEAKAVVDDYLSDTNYIIKSNNKEYPYFFKASSGSWFTGGALWLTNTDDISKAYRFPTKQQTVRFIKVWGIKNFTIEEI